AGIFKNVVYPLGQTGMTGLAIEAGAKLQNFAEWQFGIASTKFRWNLSGSYQQVIPRYLVLEDDGTYREFLPDYFDDPADMLLSIFLKGYQWPFAAKHVEGSSRVDMALFGQLSMGKRVFLDYMHNPAALTDLSILPEEARDYLIKSGSTGDTPFDRLMQMNPGAVDLYRSHDIHLDREYLEISLSAQHNNGGVAVDADWQSTIPGLFAAGEAAGTFGAVRPGGSALNSGQVGAIRLAEAIAFKAPRRTPSEEVLTDTKADVEELVAEIENASRSERSLLGAAREIMSDAASALRSDSALDAAEETITYLLATFPQGFGAKTPAGIIDSLVARDTLLSALALLSAEKLALSTNGSRGSALYYTDDTPVPENPAYRDKVMETFWNGTAMESCHIPVRPLPNPENWFEAVWKEYRETRNL
ncbi:MAG: FAD-binding protein, partial [Clostridia bacterium]|nr:FAD-binding protein [Clostridia bacterium]